MKIKTKRFLLSLLSGLWMSALFFGITTSQVQASASDWDQNDHVGVRLVSAVNATGNLEKIPFGLEFKIKKNWKIYWRNPGDAGYPPQPDWDEQENIKESDLIWPRPNRFSVLGLQSLGYKDHVILPIDITPIKIGNSIRLKGIVNYLTCDDLCIPYTAELDLELPAGNASPSDYAQDINKFRSQVPIQSDMNEQSLVGLTLIDTGFQEGGKDILLKLVATSTSPIDKIDAIIEGPIGSFFDATVSHIANDKKSAVLSITGGGITEEQRKEAPFIVTLWSGDKSIETSTIFKSGTGHIANLDNMGSEGLFGILLIALLGGLILNLMPCVLPVISLKVLSIMEHGGSSNRKIRLSFLATIAGILTAFLILALALIGFKQAGFAIGWGVQFQQPIFLIIMIFVVIGFAANLLGYFEIQLPSSLATSAATTGQGKGYKGHFLTGVFATLLATPCSAPFLGTAVGFALSQGPIEILSVFFALGLGLAAPYMIFMFFPVLANKLPRPGPWMQWLKYILAAALILTAIWLATVLTISIGAILAWTGFGLSLAMLFILYRRKGNSSSSHPKLTFIAILPLMLALFLPLAPMAATGSTNGTNDKDIIKWQVFDEASIPTLVNSGKIVFVDVTADWCITCQFNKSTVLNDEEISTLLNQDNVVAMQADWTLPNSDIANYLNKYGRYGIPFNIIYSQTNPKGIILPELLSINSMSKAMKDSSSFVSN